MNKLIIALGSSDYIIAIFSLLVGAFINHLLTSGRENRKEKRERISNFLDIVTEIAVGFEDAPFRDLFGNYEKSIPKIRMETAKIVRDVWFWRRGKFLKLRNQYCEINKLKLTPKTRSITISKEQIQMHGFHYPKNEPVSEQEQQHHKQEALKLINSKLESLKKLV